MDFGLRFGVGGLSKRIGRRISHDDFQLFACSVKEKRKARSAQKLTEKEKRKAKARVNERAGTASYFTWLLLSKSESVFRVSCLDLSQSQR